MMKEPPINAKELVPHRGAMLLLDELSKCEPQFMEGKAVVRPENPFVDAEGLEAVCLVELLAQLAAAGEGYEAIKTGKPVKIGYLVGINDFVITGKAAVGEELDLRLSKSLNLNNFTMAEGGVYRGQECLASGKIKLFITDMPSDRKITTSMMHPEVFPAGIEPPASREGIIHKSVRNNLASLDIPGNGSASGEIRLNDDFPGFKGHFPGYPILPGVVALEMAMVLCEESCRFPLALTGIERAKFSRQVSPGDTVKAELSVQGQGDAFDVQARLTVGGKPAAGFILKMRRDAPNL